MHASHNADATPTRTPGAAPRLDRRSFLAASAACALAAPSTIASAPRAPRPRDTRRASPPRARNIILMVSDGMSIGTLTLADMVRRKRDGRPSTWVDLWSHPGVVRAQMSTHALDSLVTDSAAAGSAWGCGRKVNNGWINMSPDGTEHEPVFLTAKARGMKAGVVTTTRVTHATPASCVANIPDRDLEHDIAQQLLERETDVILGGGRAYFDTGALRTDPNVVYLPDRAELLGHDPRRLGDRRLVGLFADQHLPFEIDRTHDVPTLAEMSRSALDTLRAMGGEGFILQIEGGRVDHAAHANDAAALINDQLAFDDAIGTVLDWTSDRDDTLVIVTTDHGNANPGLTLYKEPGNQGFDRLTRAKHSFDWVNDRLRAEDARKDVERMLQLLEQASGVELADDQRGIVRRAFIGETVNPFLPQNKITSVLGAVLANHTGVSFVSPNHTADLVELLAFGPGAQAITPHIDNTDLHAVMLSALGVQHAGNAAP